METVYVIYKEEYGIFLGECLGLGFWSKLDPAGQDCVVCFAKEQEAEDYIKECKMEDSKVIPVKTKGWGNPVTMEECVAAGLPPWSVKQLSQVFRVS